MLRYQDSLSSLVFLMRISSVALFLCVLFNGTVVSAADLRPEEIITILPKDRIPAILSPSFKAGNKISWLKGEDAIIGVEINGESHAYPVAILSSREIVNDKVGGIPIAVTW